MVQVNEYFQGKVKSLTVNAVDGKRTVGVMEPGEYEFGTAQKERMTVVVGELTVKLPDKSNWKTFKAGSSFEVSAQSKFQLKIGHDAAYVCEYL